MPEREGERREGGGGGGFWQSQCPSSRPSLKILTRGENRVKAEGGRQTHRWHAPVATMCQLYRFRLAWSRPTQSLQPLRLLWSTQGMLHRQGCPGAHSEHSCRWISCWARMGDPAPGDARPHRNLGWHWVGHGWTKHVPRLAVELWGVVGWQRLDWVVLRHSLWQYQGGGGDDGRGQGGSCWACSCAVLHQAAIQL